jgi:hypothetical protein
MYRAWTEQQGVLRKVGDWYALTIVRGTRRRQQPWVWPSMHSSQP